MCVTRGTLVEPIANENTILLHCILLCLIKVFIEPHVDSLLQIKGIYDNDFNLRNACAF